MAYAVGHIINKKFQIVGLLGEGAMGQVYKAQQLPLGRLVALKTMRVGRATPEQIDEFRQRFLLEASLCAQLAHPNVLTIYDYGKTDDAGEEYFIAMELLDGVTLDDRLQEKPLGLPVAEAVRLSIEIARGLREAHGKGVVHRDLKPANIMLVPGEEGVEHVKLVDFGLVKRLDEKIDRGMTVAGAFLGTPLYMPPEQASPRQVDHRADLYALGVILFECLTGALPYEGETAVEILSEKAKKQPPTLRSKKPMLAVSPALQAAVTRLLQPSPSARFQSAEELLKALRSAPEAQQGKSMGDSWVSEQPALVIKTAGRYQVGRLLSRTPQAKVYEATHIEQGRKVAVKIFTPPSEREVVRLKRDLPALLSLQGPGCAAAFEVGTVPVGDRALPFVAMEYLRGKTLRDLLASEGALAPQRVVSLARWVLDGLSEVHSHGYVHGQLGPEHVMVQVSSGGRERATLFSQGISAASDARTSSPRNSPDTLGLLNRTAPEVLQGGRRTELSDIYSLGVTLYECLTGRLPISEAGFARSTAEGRLPSPAALEPSPIFSPELVGLVNNAMAADPRDRVASVAKMMAALEQAPEAGSDVAASSRRQSVLSSVAVSQRKLWSRGTPSLWVLGADPAFRKPALAEAIGALQRNFDVSVLDQDQQEALLPRVERGEIGLPWVVLFGDLDVILENPLLPALSRSGELSRILISTHANPDMLRRSINFCGLDQSLCLPASREEILDAVSAMIERASSIRAHYDQLRRALIPAEQPPELKIDSSLSQRTPRVAP